VTKSNTFVFLDESRGKIRACWQRENLRAYSPSVKVWQEEGVSYKETSSERPKNNSTSLSSPQFFDLGNSGTSRYGYKVVRKCRLCRTGGPMLTDEQGQNATRQSSIERDEA
jgi:hypothetical protein